MTLLSQITAADWQPEIGADASVVQGLDDIDQCIRVILATPLGSDPHRPEFGSDIDSYLDYPQNRVRPHLVREAVAAIKRWEPRISEIAVAVSFPNGDASVVFDIQWTGAAGDAGSAAILLGRSP
jgi:phage baseplate assembly protein W